MPRRVIELMAVSQAMGWDMTKPLPERCPKAYAAAIRSAPNSTLSRHYAAAREPEEPAASEPNATAAMDRVRNAQGLLNDIEMVVDQLDDDVVADERSGAATATAQPMRNLEHARALLNDISAVVAELDSELDADAELESALTVDIERVRSTSLDSTADTIDVQLRTEEGLASISVDRNAKVRHTVLQHVNGVGKGEVFLGGELVDEGVTFSAMEAEDGCTFNVVLDRSVAGTYRGRTRHTECYTEFVLVMDSQWNCTIWGDLCDFGKRNRRKHTGYASPCSSQVYVNVIFL